MYDKRIADEADMVFGQTIELLQDSGFQGFGPAKTTVVQPLKKPRGKELSQEEKEENKQKASERVVVEHAIGQVKVWRIVKEPPPQPPGSSDAHSLRAQ